MAPPPFSRLGGSVLHGESTYRGRKVAELWWPLRDGQEDDVAALIAWELAAVMADRAERGIAAAGL